MNAKPEGTADESKPTTRQLAVAHLWGHCGWSVHQLGDLFDVSDRTIKRDLRAGRAARILPRRGRGLSTDLAQQARSLLAACARLREAVGPALSAIGPDRAGSVSAVALATRLFTEERKLLSLIATLPGGTRIGPAETDELPEYLAPDLLSIVSGLARAGSGPR